MVGSTLFYICVVCCGIAFTQVINNDVNFPVHRFGGKECYGRTNGLGLIGNSHLHYERMRRHYSNCTYIRGSLEITHLDDPNILYDLSFLSSIRVVTGYVLIALVTQNTTISLDNLQVIRGDILFKSSSTSQRYGLFVALNFGPGKRQKNGLQALKMPNLREISNGDISIVMSPYIPYVTTIDWDVIAPGAHINIPDFPAETPTCHPSCKLGRTSHCWGPGSFDCQALIPAMDTLRCHPSCPGRCFLSRKESGCCPDVCAGGCFGSKSFQCLTCKYAVYFDRCVKECPVDTFMWAGVCEL